MNADLAAMDFGNLINHFINRRNLGDQIIATQVNERFGHVVQVSRSTIRNWRNKSDTNIQDWKQLAAVAVVLDVSEEEVSLLLKKGRLPTLEKLWSEASKEEQGLLEKWMSPAPLQSIDARLETITSGVDEIRGYFPKSEQQSGLGVAELESRYRQAAAKEWAYLDIETGARVPLQQVYVMLEAIRSTRPSPVTERDDMVLSPEQILNADLGDKTAKTEPLRPMPLADVLNKHQHLVILGEAGAGKSTTLQSIALALTGEQNQLDFGLAEERVPVLVRLREHNVRLAEGVLESVLAATVRPFLGISIVEAQNLVEKWRDGDRLAVLLDGLDELSENGRRRAFQAIRSFVPSRGKTCRVIVTSRITGYQDLGEPLREFVLKPFANVADALPYATGWLTTLNKYSIEQADEAEREAQALLTRMEGHPSLKRILDNPLFLRLALEIYVREERLVHNRADLYQTAVEEIAWRRAEYRSVEFSKPAVVKALQWVAWAIHVEGKRQRSGIIKALGNAELGADPEALFEALRTRMGLVLLHGETGDRRVAFSHKIFQEYLVAQRLAAAWQKEGNRDNAWAFLRPRLHHPDWHEPVLLVAGILAKDSPSAVTNFVKFVFKAKGPYEDILHRDLRLSVELMGSGIEVDDNIVEQIMNRLRQILSKQRSQLDFFRSVPTEVKRTFLIMALSKIGSERVTSTLTSLLQDEGIYMRWIIVKALKQMGDASAVPALQAALQVVDGYTRYHMVLALGEIGGQTAVPALQAALQDENSEVRSLAVERLGTIGGETAVAALQAALQDANSAVREWVVFALGKIGGQTAVPALQAALQDENSEVRSLAVERLGTIGGETAVAALQAALQDEDKHVRSEAVGALVRIGDALPVPTLEAALHHEDSYVRSKSVEMLGKIGGETAVAALQAALQDEDKFVRWRVVSALEQIGSETAVTALQAALRHADSDVRRKAVEALNRIGDETAVAALQAALQDEDPLLRWRALFALEQIGGETALQAALQHANSHVRLIAVDALEQRGDETAAVALEVALKDEDSLVRKWAAMALGQIRGETTVAALQAALQDDDRYVRWRAISALGKIGGESALAALQAPLQDEDPLLRWRAVEVLVMMGDVSAVPALQAALHSYQRSRAVKMLGKIGGETVVPALQEALQVEDSSVRRKAVEALEQIGGEAAISALRAALQDEDSDVRWRAISALEKIGGEAAISALRAALQDEDSIVCWRAISALEKIGGETVVPALQEALQVENSSLRRKAVEALGKIGEQTAVPALQAALQDEDIDVRRKAVEALGKIGEQTAVPVLQAALQDEDINVRRKAVEALKQIGDETAVAALQAALQDEESDVCRQAIWALESCLFSMSPSLLKRLIKQLQRPQTYEVYRLFDKAIVRLTELQVENLRHTDPFMPPTQPPWK